MNHLKTMQKVLWRKRKYSINTTVFDDTTTTVTQSGNIRDTASDNTVEEMGNEPQHHTWSCEGNINT